jgi:hypothetical protein
MRLNRPVLVAMCAVAVACGSDDPAAGPDDETSNPNGPEDGPKLADCPVLPGNHVFNSRIDGLRVQPRSDAFIATIGDMYSLPSGWRSSWTAYFDLTSMALRPAGWTSADAAGYPILPLLVREDEVSTGEIKHAFRFTINSNEIRRAYAWPARHLTNNGTTSDMYITGAPSAAWDDDIFETVRTCVPATSRPWTSRRWRAPAKASTSIVERCPS